MPSSPAAETRRILIAKSWLIYFGDVQAGWIELRAGAPYDAPR